MVDKEQIRFLYHLQGVRELFDDYADTFDEELVQGLRYNVPSLLRQQLPKKGNGGEVVSTQVQQFQRCLDLGCGTGLSGLAFRDCCAYMEGVDISPKMIQKAKALQRETSSGGPAYNAVKASDLQGHLRKCPDHSFDLILSVDVVMYLYDLAPMIEQIKRVLSNKKGSILAFSTEALEKEIGEDALERDSGRYAHARDYVLKLVLKDSAAVEEGEEDSSGSLKLLSVENVLGRMDSGQEIRSDLFVFERT